jgi:hypothetical protein
MPIQNRLLVALGFFILPAILYVGLITRFTFGLFDPTYGWQAYNYFALALADGRQAIPAEVIAGEGLYINGQVFMYYGALPAALRLPLIAFVDLRHVPVSNFLVSIMLIAGQWAMQVAILRIFIANGRTTVWADRFMLVLVSTASWFMSGPFLIAQNANFYHEPYAAAVMLTGFYLALLSDDLLVRKRRPAGSRLLVYAILAGLSVFTRQTCAVGLYAVTLALLLPEWPALRTETGKTIRETIRRAFLPLLLLFLFGIGFIAMSYFRTGAFGSSWTVENYGYYILGNNRPRLRTMIDQQFSAIRIIPNTIYFLFGGQILREKLILDWGGGLVVTFGWAVRWAIYAAVPLIMAVAGQVCIVRRLRARQPLAVLVALCALGLLLTMLIIFAYGTTQYRYNSEAWPFIAWLMLIAMRDLDPTRLFGRRLPLAVGTAIALSVISLAYSTNLRSSLIADAPRDRGSLRVGVTLPPELIAQATAVGARDPDVIAIRNSKGPDPDLPIGWKPPPDFPGSNQERTR